jgi:hypothetical protein
VASTEKRLSDRRGTTSCRVRIAAITLRDISAVSSRLGVLGVQRRPPLTHRIIDSEALEPAGYTASAPSVAARSGLRTGTGSGSPGSTAPAGSRGDQSWCGAPRTRQPGWPARYSRPTWSCAVVAVWARALPDRYDRKAIRLHRPSGPSSPPVEVMQRVSHASQAALRVDFFGGLLKQRKRPRGGAGAIRFGVMTRVLLWRFVGWQ